MDTGNQINEENIRQLLQDDLKGNYEYFVKWCKPYVEQTVLGIVQKRQEVDDVSQKVFTNAYRHLKRHGIERVKHLKAWIGSIAKHEASKHRKEMQKMNEREYSYMHFERDGPGEEREIDIADPDNIEDTVIRSIVPRIAPQKLKVAISHLREHHRSVIKLNLEGYTNAQVAKKLGYPEGTVKAIIRRCRRSLLLELIDPDTLPKLPEKYRSVVELYLQGYTNKKIAEQLDRPIGTVKSILSNGIHLLIELSEDY